ncbi:hypothetical protein AB1L30_04990 [Bremerella sp. JC817]|uniref:hypothetical protein n=1 Tax=Bremerella sp. JC817 TaxID=3231756 RepID=UPI003458419C
MGLFNLLKTLFSSKQVAIGNTDPVCPYCEHRLDKMPGRKKKCPACAKSMLVRTRPSDRKKILIKEDQAVLIEEQWSIANGTHDEFLAARRDHQLERARLQKQLRRNPSSNEVEYSQLAKSLDHFAKQMQWGFYRTARLAMGDLLKNDQRFEEALNVYLEVCYIDLNGPNNCGTTEPEILREDPPFEPEFGLLVMEVICDVDVLFHNLNLTKAQLKFRFFQIANNVRSSLGTPLKPNRAWHLLLQDLN